MADGAGESPGILGPGAPVGGAGGLVCDGDGAGAGTEAGGEATGAGVGAAGGGGAATGVAAGAEAGGGVGLAVGVGGAGVAVGELAGDWALTAATPMQMRTLNISMLGAILKGNAVANVRTWE